jgi:hypothetical protein
MNAIVTVLTCKSVEHMISDRGTQSWRADRSRLKGCDYVVCARNQYGPYRAEGTEEHRHAFLIGRISDVVDADDGDGRQKIVFTSYALVEGPEMPLKGANPVQYHESLEALGIDVDALEWKEMAAPVSPIIRAKEMLAAAYQVPVEAVEINIRM